MLNKFRIIPRFEIKSRNLIKGIKMEGLKKIDNFLEKIINYQNQGADEIIIDDIVASLYSREIDLEFISKVAELVNIPLTVGGGIKNIYDIDKLMNAGADRVSINSAAVEDVNIIIDASKKFGRQCIVSQVLTKKINDDYKIFYLSGRENPNILLKDWLSLLEEIGSGEINLLSIDNDGMLSGCDKKLINNSISDKKISVIYGGGISNISDIQFLIKNNFQGVIISQALYLKLLQIDKIKESLIQT